MHGTIVYPRYTMVERIILGMIRIMDRLLSGFLKILRAKLDDFQLRDFVDQIFDRRN